jgi:hypothetical protein
MPKEEILLDGMQVLPKKILESKWPSIFRIENHWIEDFEN